MGPQNKRPAACDDAGRPVELTIGERSGSSIARLSRISPGALRWRQASGLLVLSDHVRMHERRTRGCDRIPLTSLPRSLLPAHKRRPGFAAGRQGAQAPFERFFLARFMAVCVGRPSGLPEPCPGLRTRRMLPPFTCFAVGGGGLPNRRGDLP